MADPIDPDDLAAEMLEDLEELTGISIGEMMADELETPERDDDFEEFEVYEEPTESEELDLENPYDDDPAEYLDGLFDDIDVEADVETDQYGDD